MATELKFNICGSQNCEKFTFTETTGAYVVTTNEGGWGAPNETTGDATAATLTVTNPTSTTSTVIDLFATTFFPTTDSSIEHEIASADLGITGDVLPDGTYEFQYDVTTGVTTYTTYKKVYNMCNAKCCVYKLFGNLDACSCSSVDIDRAMTAYSYLLALEFAASCGAEDRFDKLLTLVNALCDSANDNCQTC